MIGHLLKANGKDNQKKSRSQTGEEMRRAIKEIIAIKKSSRKGYRKGASTGWVASTALMPS